MKIEHIAMYVSDLEKARDFFVTYLGGHADAGYHNKTTDFRSYFIHFENGTRLELMTRPEISDLKEEAYGSGYHHLAFSTGSKEQVDLLTERLRSDGYEVVSGPRMTGDGYYESCIAGIEGNLIELTV